METDIGTEINCLDTVKREKDYFDKAKFNCYSFAFEIFDL